ncbi:MAG: ACT domain-containing protein [Lysobacterales bacterium]|jgi:glycine cleavage system regulatory protein
MNSSIVLSVLSDDRPGIVETLSDVLASNGGNWTESSMLSLAGQFAGILLAELPEERSDAFLDALSALQADGIHVTARTAPGSSEDNDTRAVALELVGQDRPGIVHDISEVLARHAVNVHELETTVQSASMSGERLFLAHARVFIPAATDTDKLREELEDLANELMVDLSLETPQT